MEKKQTEEEREEERQTAEKKFLKATESEGQFEEAMAGLDELDDDDAKRLLGLAACKGKPPCKCEYR